MWRDTHTERGSTHNTKQKNMPSYTDDCILHADDFFYAYNLYTAERKKSTKTPAHLRAADFHWLYAWLSAQVGRSIDIMHKLLEKIYVGKIEF